MDPDEIQEQQRPSIGLSSQDQWAEWEAAGRPTMPNGGEEEGDESGEGGLLNTTARGVARAFNQTSNLVVSAGRGIAKGTGLYKLFGDDEWDEEWLDWYETSIEEANPAQFDIAGRAEGVWGFYEAMVQFGTGFVGASGVLKNATGILQQAPSLIRAATAGAAADFAVFDAQEERLSNLIQSGPEWLQNPVTDFLAADEEDTEAEGRLKNALEGLFLGSVIDGFMAGVRTLRTIRAHRRGAITKGEAAKRIERHLEEADEARIEEHEARQAEGTVPLYRVERPDDNPEVWNAVVMDESRGRLPEGAPETRSFDSSAEAHRFASSANTVDELYRDPGPTINLKPSQRSNVRVVMNRIMSGADPKDSDALVEGLDFNFGRVTSEDDTKAMLNSISEVLDEEFSAATRRSSEGFGQSNEETIRLAEGLVRGVSGAEMVNHLKNLTGTTRNLPQTVLAARIMMHGQSKRLLKLSRAVDLDPTNALAVRSMTEEMDGLATMAVNLAGVSSDIARALQAHSIRVSDDALEGLTKGADEASQSVAVKKDKPFSSMVRKSGMTAREIAAVARSLQLTDGSPDALLRALRLTADATREGAQRNSGAWDKLVSFRASMMLSGPKTHATNLFSSTMTALQVPVEVMLGGVRSRDWAMTRQGFDMLTAPAADAFWIVRQAFSGAKRAWKEQRSVLDPRFVKDEQGWRVAMQDPQSSFWLNVLRAPGRALTSGDEFVKRMAYLSHVRSQSLRAIRDEQAGAGFKWGAKEVNARIYDDMASSLDEGGEALWVNSLEHARYTTFTRKLHAGSFGHGLQEMANNNVGVRLILPFVRTPVNIFNFAVQRMPIIGRFQREMREMYAAGGEQRAIAQGRQMMGTLMYTVGGFMAHQGQLTGSGPDNPALRAQMLDAGWQPYSVRIGNKWVSYRRLEPIATPLAIMADFVETLGELDTQTAEEATIALSTAMASSVTSKTFLLGLTEFFEAVGSGEEYQMEQFLTSFGTSFAPAATRQLNADPMWREAEGFVQQLRGDIPGLSQGLEPRRNLFGEPVMKTSRQVYGPVGGYVNTTMNPFTVVDASDIDDIQMELANLGKSISMPRDELASGRIRLRDGDRWENTDPDRQGQSPYDRWMQLVGENGLRDRLTALMRSAAWENATVGSELAIGGTRWIMANQIIQAAQDGAWAQTLQEYPDLARAIQNERRAEIEALFAN